MKNKTAVKETFQRLALPLFVLVAISGSAPAAALQPARSLADTSPVCSESTDNPGSNSCALPEVDASRGTLKDIIQIGLGIIGAFALLNMVGSGLKYITSAGDPQKTSEAKKGVIFSLVGLAIAIGAEAIVAFVIHRGAP
jgi:hypothetical protein